MELANVQPAIHRTIHIHKQSTFRQLHHITQLLFDWWDTHPYTFHLHTETDVVFLNEYPPSTLTQEDQEVDERTLSTYFKQKGNHLTYEYGRKTCYEVTITLQKVLTPTERHQLYPYCIQAEHEIDTKVKTTHEAGYFPFGKQLALQDEHLVHRLNQKLTDNIVQMSATEHTHRSDEDWNRLTELTKQYHDKKPWKQITNQQIFALYDHRFEEYLFCSVLGQENGLLGLSVYIGFNGLLSLHTSLTKKLSIEQLFHLHHNLLLQFEQGTKDDWDIDGVVVCNDGKTKGQFTSYQPGYFPWKMNEKEIAMFTFALQHTLDLFKQVQLGYTIPNYMTDDHLLLLHQVKDSQVQQQYVTFEQMIQKVSPSQVTIPSKEMTYLMTKSRRNITVEFSLQYVDVPIQRLKNKRPFLPLSSVIVNQASKQLIYHNIYNARLDYMMVQAEFVQMIQLLGAMPSRILTDELTYHYLKPLLSIDQFPIEVCKELPVTDGINTNVSHYLLTKAE